MKLYYTAGSPPSRAVLMTIRNLDLEVEIENLNLLNGENKSEEFLQLNPSGQVPVLVDGDFILSESKAIQAYLVNNYQPGDSLYPSDPQARAVVDQRLYFDATNVFGSLSAALGPIFFCGQTEVSVVIRDKLKGALKQLDNFLEDKEFFAGENPTIADIAILSNVIQAKNAFGSIGELENLENWYVRCESLPGFEENVEAGKCVSDGFKVMGIELEPLE